jgi:hypothetical protein
MGLCAKLHFFLKFFLKVLPKNNLSPDRLHICKPYETFYQKVSLPKTTSTSEMSALKKA